MKKPRRPKDPNQLAKFIVDAATEGRKNPHAVALGRKGGKIGGKMRAEKLSKERRIEIAQEAAKARWGKKPQ